MSDSNILTKKFLYNSIICLIFIVIPIFNCIVIASPINNFDLPFGLMWNYDNKLVYNIIKKISINQKLIKIDSYDNGNRITYTSLIIFHKYKCSIIATVVSNKLESIHICYPDFFYSSNCVSYDNGIYFIKNIFLNKIDNTYLINKEDSPNSDNLSWTFIYNDILLTILFRDIKSKKSSLIDISWNSFTNSINNEDNKEYKIQFKTEYILNDVSSILKNIRE